MVLVGMFANWLGMFSLVKELDDISDRMTTLKSEITWSNI